MKHLPPTPFPTQEGDTCSLRSKLMNGFALGLPGGKP
jgi:hypothetical protein